MAAKLHGKIDGLGGLCIEIHQATLASGAATVNTSMRSAQHALAVFASGQTPATEGLRVTISGGTLTITSSNASSVLVVDVWVLGF